MKGATVLEVAKAVGCAPSTVRRWCPINPAKVPKSPVGRRPGQVAEEPMRGSKTQKIVAEMRRGVKATLGELADRHGVSRQLIFSVKEKWCPQWKAKRVYRTPEQVATARAKAAASRVPQQSPLKGTKTAAIVKAWKAGKVHSANQAARVFGVKWDTARKALFRWTDYDGKPRA